MHVGSLQDDLNLKVMDEDVTTDDFVIFNFLISLCIGGHGLD